MQLSIANGDLTNTFIPFQYFYNTRADKSLAYGPGLLEGCGTKCPAEFKIIAKNDHSENRTSGRDIFEVKITQKMPLKEVEVDPEADPDAEVVEQKAEIREIKCDIVDTDNGQYDVKYTCETEGVINISILFLDDKGKMVPVRGCPYSIHCKDGVDPKSNLMTGKLMGEQIAKQIISLQTTMTDSKKEIHTKDKNLSEVKVLLSVKEKVEQTQKNTDNITLLIDQLDESLKLFQLHKLSKEPQLKALVKINKDWVDLKKIAKDVKKEIAPLVQQENDRNKVNIKQLEEKITAFNQEMKKREFFQYKCGTKIAKEKLNGVFDELTMFENDIKDFGFNAEKFGQPDLINKAVKDIETIKITVNNMKGLWDHILICQTQFTKNMENKW